MRFGKNIARRFSFSITGEAFFMGQRKKDHKSHVKRLVMTLLFGSIAVLALLFGLVMAASRGDSEASALVQDGQTAFSIETPSRVSFVMCASNAHAVALQDMSQASYSCQMLPVAENGDGDNPAAVAEETPYEGNASEIPCQIQSAWFQNLEADDRRPESIDKERTAQLFPARPLYVSARFAQKFSGDRDLLCRTDKSFIDIWGLDKNQNIENYAEKYGKPETNAENERDVDEKTDDAEIIELNTDKNAIYHDASRQKGYAQIRISAPDDVIVVAAISPLANVKLEFGLWAIFVVSLFLMMGVQIRYRFKHGEFSPQKTIYGRLDGVLVYAVAMAIMLEGISFVSRRVPSDDTLFPSFFTVFFSFIVCAASYALASLSVFLFRKISPVRGRSNSACPAETKKIEDSKIIREVDESFDKNLKSKENNDDYSNCCLNICTIFKIIRRHPVKSAVCLGLLNACLAMLTTDIAPLPGLTLTELSSSFISTAFVLAYSVFLAAIAEECVFRGVIQGSLEARPDSRHPRVQNALAIGITAIAFTLIHVPQSVEHLWALIPIGIFSFTACGVRQITGSVFPSILVHMTYNGTLVLPSMLTVL